MSSGYLCMGLVMFNRVKFFLFILFFAGSVVLIAAKELHRTHGRLVNDSERARRIIQALHGDVLVHAKDGPDMFEPGMLPVRQNGSYLQSEDKKMLNSLLGKVLPSPSEEEK